MYYINKMIEIDAPPKRYMFVKAHVCMELSTVKMRCHT